jgi:hypothetical protein
MKYLIAFLVGGLTAAAGVFLHLSYPPTGLVLALAGTAATFWSLGRHYGKRRYKFGALLGWLVVVNDATTFGSGGELLVQGDRLGMTFLASGIAIVVVTTFFPVNS